MILLFPVFVTRGQQSPVAPNLNQELWCSKYSSYVFDRLSSPFIQRYSYFCCYLSGYIVLTHFQVL